MYKNFFGLRESPFNDNPDPRYLYLTPTTRKALEDLTCGINTHQGCILLTGEVGTGKTTLINCLLDWLHHRQVPTAFIFNCRLSASSLLEFILNDFGIPCDIRLKGNMLLRLNDWLVEQYRIGQTPVLIVDEAQGLPIELLEDLRLLLNIETSSKKLLQIILAGQPELDEKLMRPELRQFRQRINLRCHTAPLTREETHCYIQERLRTAGAVRQGIFDPEAMDAAFRYSGGIPRILNLLCHHSLIAAFVDNACPVPAYIVHEVAQELSLSEAASEPRVPPPPPVAPRPTSFPKPSAPPPAESSAPVFASSVSASPIHRETLGNLASRTPLAVAGSSPMRAQNSAALATEPNVQASVFLKLLAESIAGLQAKQNEKPPGPVIVPPAAPHLVSAHKALHPQKPTPTPVRTFLPAAAKTLRRVPVPRPSSALLLKWNRSLERWWSRNLSRELFWKTFTSTGLAGTILFVTALQMSTRYPGVHFARVFCGYLGLLLCAVALSSGASLLFDSTTGLFQSSGRWSKPIGSFMRWMRKPIHL